MCKICKFLQIGELKMPFKIGDKVKIVFPNDGYEFLQDRVATVVKNDSDDFTKIRVSFNETWQGYFKAWQLEKINE